MKLLAGDQDDLSRAVLLTLTRRHDSMTYVIRNCLTMDRVGRDWRGISTDQVLSACRRLQRLGHVEEAPTSYVVQKCWRATDAGRAAIEAGS
ncbi:hypothetical protein [Bosea sp. (in: a-proteobacteria)]|jgi:hypothetical protein|uniref:hypothetical protein n=1 Tax=Bosea sp. (in: a-proteobacteria) TaxID=1871050 RepID=UPI00356A0154